MPLAFHYETLSCLYIRICFSKSSRFSEDQQVVYIKPLKQLLNTLKARLKHYIVIQNDTET